jgi:S-DNA-T family DNA segregation ATPase FtsK/SpoIIIE
MTAPTTNGHRPRLLKRTEGPDHPGKHGAYPKDPYPTLDVEEAPQPKPAVEPDINSQNSGAPRPGKLPILPAWMKTGEGLRRNVTHSAPILLNLALYWGIKRGYIFKPLGWAGRGLWLAGHELVSFALDLETRAMRKDAARRKDGRARAYERAELHKSRRHRALGTAGWLAGVGGVAMVLTGPTVSLAVRVPLALAVLVALAKIGRTAPADGTGSLVLRPDQSRDPADTIVRSDRVVAVFDKAKIPGVMTVGGTRRRDGDPEGWETVVDLPEGDTFAEVQGKHVNLCSAWRIEKERLYLRRGAHEGQVHMTLFDQDPMTGDPVRTPLRDLPQLSFWDPIPIGTTAYGDPYSLVLPGSSGLWVCSAPGYGKTNLLQLILAAAALGIRVRIFIHDGKGEGDLEVYGDLADHFSQGSNDAAGRACAAMLAEVKKLRVERTALIRRVRSERRDLMPSSQITRAVTEDPEWDLPLILVLVDELNLLVRTESGEAIQTDVADIAEGCRSGGIIPVIAGQNFRAKVLDGAQSSIGHRVAFKTNSPEDSNMILGKGQVGEGFNTSKWPDNYQGVAVVRPAGQQVQSGTHQIRTHLGEYEDHVAIAARARHLRGEVAPAGVRLVKGIDLLAQVLDAMSARNVVPVDELATALGLDVEALVGQLREVGVPVKPSRGHGNQRAVRRQDVADRM